MPAVLTTPRRASVLAALAVLSLWTAPVRAQTDSAPADAEGAERALREERVRHADQLRKLAEEEDRLRAALDAARARLAEAELRRASLRKLVEEIQSAAASLKERAAAGRKALLAVAASIRDAAARKRPLASADPGVLDEKASSARRIRLLFRGLDRELAAARSVAVAPRERDGALGHEVRLGALATFFVPASGAPALLEPSGRALPDPVGAALREIVRQASARSGGTLVLVPWWGAP
jgi:hypothetical protein